MKIILAVIRFNILSLVRNLKSSGIMFVLPVVFMGIFAMAFGGNSSAVTFRAGVLVDPAIQRYAPDFNAILNSLHDTVDTVKVTSTVYTDEAKLKDDLTSGKIDSGMVVSPSPDPTAYPLQFDLLFKEQNYQTGQILSVEKDVIEQVNSAQSGMITTEFLTTQGDVSSFDLLAPGLIIYGLLILIPGIAQTFTAITEKKYIFRFANSQANSAQIIAGSVVYYLLLAFIQILLLFFTARACGYQASGNVLLAVFPGLLSALFVIGVGLLIGSFVKKTDAATNIGTILSIIMGFFSGSFIPGIGQVLEFKLFGQQMQFNDLLPSKWGTVAMEKVLSQNLGLGDITTELTILAISGVVLLSAGIFVYQKKQLSVQN